MEIRNSTIVPSWLIYSKNDIVVDIADTVISVYADAFGKQTLSEIKLQINICNQPITYLPSDSWGGFMIFLPVKEVCYAQMIYQLSHELSHVVMNCYPRKRQLEVIGESLCCAATFYAMDVVIKDKWTANSNLSQLTIADDSYSKNGQPYIEALSLYLTNAKQKWILFQY